MQCSLPRQDCMSQDHLQDPDTSQLQMRSEVRNDGVSLGSQQRVTPELSKSHDSSLGFQIQGHPIGKFHRHQRFAVDRIESQSEEFDFLLHLLIFRRYFRLYGADLFDADGLLEMRRRLRRRGKEQEDGRCPRHRKSRLQ